VVVARACAIRAPRSVTVRLARASALPTDSQSIVEPVSKVQGEQPEVGEELAGECERGHRPTDQDAVLVQHAQQPPETGVAGGMNANIRTIGGALGASAMVSIVTAGAAPGGLPKESG
jgi:hypothetical protein